VYQIKGRTKDKKWEELGVEKKLFNVDSKKRMTPGGAEANLQEREGERFMEGQEILYAGLSIIYERFRSSQGRVAHRGRGGFKGIAAPDDEKKVSGSKSSIGKVYLEVRRETIVDKRLRQKFGKKKIRGGEPE